MEDADCGVSLVSFTSSLVGTGRLEGGGEVESSLLEFCQHDRFLFT
jgi:hypothetical protein